MAALATMAHYENNDIDDALVFLDSIGASSTMASDDPRTIELQKMHQALTDLQVLRKSLSEAQASAGRPLENLDELVMMGLLPIVPLDPWGERYLLDVKDQMPYSNTRLVPSTQPQGRYTLDYRQLEPAMARDLLDDNVAPYDRPGQLINNPTGD